MHVRVSVLTVDPGKLDDVVSYVAGKARSVVEDKPGNLGMSMAVNELGVAVVETFWVSGDAMRESERPLSATRAEAARRGNGTVSVEHYTVASVVHVAEPEAGSGVRLTRADVDPNRVDEAIAAYEDAAVPWLTESKGFRLARLYVDRRTGRSMTEAVWADRIALADSRGVAATIRADGVAATDAVVRAVEEYELIFISGGFRPARSVPAAVGVGR
jgi:hypothetical protein